MKLTSRDLLHFRLFVYLSTWLPCLNMQPVRLMAHYLVEQSGFMCNLIAKEGF
jgi:hypothetical protein